KEGINLPRYPSLPGRLKAKKKAIPHLGPERTEDGLKKIRLKVPKEQAGGAEILGEGPQAAPKIVEILKKVGVLEL
ncbi:MAG TPA: hypothetical protein VGD99_25525, partial [Anaerolineae bacterium]